MISCGHIDGVRAENGPPGVGVKLVVLFAVLGMAETLTPSPVCGMMMSSSSSSDKVSAESEKETTINGILQIEPVQLETVQRRPLQNRCSDSIGILFTSA